MNLPPTSLNLLGHNSIPKYILKLTPTDNHSSHSSSKKILLAADRDHHKKPNILMVSSSSPSHWPPYCSSIKTFFGMVAGVGIHVLVTF